MSAGSSRQTSNRENPALRGPVVLATRGSGDPPAPAILASKIAAKIERELHVVSVVPPVVLSGVPFEAQIASVALDTEALQSRESDITTGDFASLLANSGKWRASVELGQPAAVVCDAASAEDATLIVLGASPQRRLRKIVAGQRASQILHGATSPVLSVVPWLKALPQRVVAGIDFSPASVRAAETALLFMEDGAEMTLINVMLPTYVYPSPQVANAELRKSVKAELERAANLLKQRTSAAIKFSTEILDGRADSELLDFAARRDADLVTVGTASAPALKRAFVGSVATQVFRSALCSVLASPPPDAR